MTVRSHPIKSAKRRYPYGHRFTLDELRHAQKTVARLILRVEDDFAIPIFERLQREIEARESHETTMARIKSVAEGKAA